MTRARTTYTYAHTHASARTRVYSCAGERRIEASAREEKRGNESSLRGENRVRVNKTGEGERERERETESIAGVAEREEEEKERAGRGIPRARPAASSAAEAANERESNARGGAGRARETERTSEANPTRGGENYRVKSRPPQPLARSLLLPPGNIMKQILSGGFFFSFHFSRGVYIKKKYIRVCYLENTRSSGASFS